MINGDNFNSWYAISLPIMRLIAGGVPLLMAVLGVYTNRRIDTMSDRVENLWLVAWISLALTFSLLFGWNVFLEEPLIQTYLKIVPAGGPPDLVKKTLAAHAQDLAEAAAIMIASHLVFFGVAILIAIVQRSLPSSEAQPPVPPAAEV